MLERFLERATRWMVRRRTIVLAVWLLPVPILGYCFFNVSHKLKSVLGSNDDAESSKVSKILAGNFTKQAQFVLLLTLHHDKITADDPRFVAASEKIHAAIDKKKVPCVREALSYHQYPLFPWLFLSKSRKTQGTAIDVKAPVDGYTTAERCVVTLRKIVRRMKNKLPLEDLEILVTGAPAVDLDIGYIVKRDARRSEIIVVVVCFFLLIWMFRSASAAFLPLITASLAVMTCLSIVFVVADYWRMSVYVSTVATMTGLGIGLDYALLYVTRYKEEVARGHERVEAIAITARTAGKAILGSGCMVIVGFSGLLIPNLGFARSVAMSGMVIVACTLLTTLTILPVLLTIWHPTLGWPRWRWFRASHEAVDRFWDRWAKMTLKHPFFALGLAAIIVSLGAPHVRHLRVKNPRHQVIPEEVEARRGIERLFEVAGEGQAYPVWAAFTTNDGKGWHGARRQRFIQAMKRIEKWPEVAKISSPAQFMPLLGFGQDMAARYVSDDKQMLWADFLPAKTDDLELDHLVVKLRREAPKLFASDPGVKVLIGGKPAMSYETKTILFSSLPWMILFVVSTAFIIMAFFFRSLAIPLKAVIFNGLSLTTTYGLLVLVFQFGYGLNLLGVEKGQEALTLGTPILLFCVLFGVSMDYEVFLVSRIQEAYKSGMSHRDAIHFGMAKTGGIITNAALVMVVTFGAFVGGTLLPMKEMGFAMALAVILDATLVRMVLVPGVLRLLGERVTWFWPFGATQRGEESAPSEKSKDID